MRRKSRNPAPSRGLAIALIFISFVGILIVISFAIKGYLLVKRSHFDGTHQFILEDITPNKTRFIAFNPDTKSVVELTINGVINQPPLFADAVVHNISFTDPLQIGDSLLIHPDVHASTLTEVDIARMALFSHNIDSSSVIQKEVTLPQDGILLGKILPQLFLDHSLYQENIAVSIVNATDVSGIGEMLAKMLGTIGVNSISITSGDTDITTSHITYIGNMTYTGKRIAELLQIPIQKDITTTGADITITIGKDMLRRLGM